MRLPNNLVGSCWLPQQPAAKVDDSHPNIHAGSRLYHQAVEKRLRLEQQREEERNRQQHQQTSPASPCKGHQSGAGQLQQPRFASVNRAAGTASDRAEQYAKLLYAEGLQKAAHKREAALREIQERQQAELAGATFQPAITDSPAALQREPHEHIYARTPDILARKEAKVAQLKQQLEQQRQHDEQLHCTFRPVTSAHKPRGSRKWMHCNDFLLRQELAQCDKQLSTAQRVEEQVQHFSVPPSPAGQKGQPDSPAHERLFEDARERQLLERQISNASASASNNSPANAHAVFVDSLRPSQRRYSITGALQPPMRHTSTASELASTPRKAPDAHHRAWSVEQPPLAMPSQSVPMRQVSNAMDLASGPVSMYTSSAAAASAAAGAAAGAAAAGSRQCKGWSAKAESAAQTRRAHAPGAGQAADIGRAIAALYEDAFRRKRCRRARQKLQEREVHGARRVSCMDHKSVELVVQQTENRICEALHALTAQQTGAVTREGVQRVLQDLGILAPQPSAPQHSAAQPSNARQMRRAARHACKEAEVLELVFAALSVHQALHAEPAEPAAIAWYSNEDWQPGSALTAASMHSSPQGNRSAAQNVALQGPPARLAEDAMSATADEQRAQHMDQQVQISHGHGPGNQLASGASAGDGSQSPSGRLSATAGNVPKQGLLPVSAPATTRALAHPLKLQPPPEGVQQGGLHKGTCRGSVESPAPATDVQMILQLAGHGKQAPGLPGWASRAAGNGHLSPGDRWDSAMLGHQAPVVLAFMRSSSGNSHGSGAGSPQPAARSSSTDGDVDSLLHEGLDIWEDLVNNSGGSPVAREAVADHAAGQAQQVNRTADSPQAAVEMVEAEFLHALSLQLGSQSGDSTQDSVDLLATGWEPASTWGATVQPAVSCAQQTEAAAERARSTSSLPSSEQDATRSAGATRSTGDEHAGAWPAPEAAQMQSADLEVAIAAAAAAAVAARPPHPPAVHRSAPQPLGARPAFQARPARLGPGGAGSAQAASVRSWSVPETSQVQTQALRTVAAAVVAGGGSAQAASTRSWSVPEVSQAQADALKAVAAAVMAGADARGEDGSAGSSPLPSPNSSIPFANPFNDSAAWSDPQAWRFQRSESARQAFPALMDSASSGVLPTRLSLWGFHTRASSPALKDSLPTRESSSSPDLRNMGEHAATSSGRATRSEDGAPCHDHVGAVQVQILPRHPAIPSPVAGQPAMRSLWSASSMSATTPGPQAHSQAATGPALMTSTSTTMAHSQSPSQAAVDTSPMTSTSSGLQSVSLLSQPFIGTAPMLRSDSSKSWLGGSSTAVIRPAPIGQSDSGGSLQRVSSQALIGTASMATSDASKSVLGASSQATIGTAPLPASDSGRSLQSVSSQGMTGAASMAASASGKSLLVLSSAAQVMAGSDALATGARRMSSNKDGQGMLLSPFATEVMPGTDANGMVLRVRRTSTDLSSQGPFISPFALASAAAGSVTSAAGGAAAPNGGSNAGSSSACVSAAPPHTQQQREQQQPVQPTGRAPAPQYQQQPVQPAGQAVAHGNQPQQRHAGLWQPPPVASRAAQAAALFRQPESPTPVLAGVHQDPAGSAPLVDHFAALKTGSQVQRTSSTHLVGHVEAPNPTVSGSLMQPTGPSAPSQAAPKANNGEALSDRPWSSHGASLAPSDSGVEPPNTLLLGSQVQRTSSRPVVGHSPALEPTLFGLHNPVPSSTSMMGEIQPASPGSRAAVVSPATAVRQAKALMKPTLSASRLHLSSSTPSLSHVAALQQTLSGSQLPPTSSRSTTLLGEGPLKLRPGPCGLPAGYPPLSGNPKASDLPRLASILPKTSMQSVPSQQGSVSSGGNPFGRRHSTAPASPTSPDSPGKASAFSGFAQGVNVTNYSTDATISSKSSGQGLMGEMEGTGPDKLAHFPSWPSWQLAQLARHARCVARSAAASPAPSQPSTHIAKQASGLVGDDLARQGSGLMGELSEHDLQRLVQTPRSNLGDTRLQAASGATLPVLADHKGPVRTTSCPLDVAQHVPIMGELSDESLQRLLSLPPTMPGLQHGSASMPSMHPWLQSAEHGSSSGPAAAQHAANRPASCPPICGELSDESLHRLLSLSPAASGLHPGSLVEELRPTASCPGSPKRSLPDARCGVHGNLTGTAAAQHAALGNDQPSAKPPSICGELSDESLQRLVGGPSADARTESGSALTGHAPQPTKATAKDDLSEHPPADSPWQPLPSVLSADDHLQERHARPPGMRSGVQSSLLNIVPSQGPGLQQTTSAVSSPTHPSSPVLMGELDEDVLLQLVGSGASSPRHTCILGNQHAASGMSSPVQSGSPEVDDHLIQRLLQLPQRHSGLQSPRRDSPKHQTWEQFTAFRPPTVAQPSSPLMGEEGEQLLRRSAQLPQMSSGPASSPHSSSTPEQPAAPSPNGAARCSPTLLAQMDAQVLQLFMQLPSADAGATAPGTGSYVQPSLQAAHLQVQPAAAARNHAPDWHRPSQPTAAAAAAYDLSAAPPAPGTHTTHTYIAGHATPPRASPLPGGASQSPTYTAAHVMPRQTWPVPGDLAQPPDGAMVGELDAATLARFTNLPKPASASADHQLPVQARVVGLHQGHHLPPTAPSTWSVSTQPGPSSPPGSVPVQPGRPPSSHSVPSSQPGVPVMGTRDEAVLNLLSQRPVRGTKPLPLVGMAKPSPSKPAENVAEGMLQGPSLQRPPRPGMLNLEDPQRLQHSTAPHSTTVLSLPSNPLQATESPIGWQAAAAGEAQPVDESALLDLLWAAEGHAVPGEHAAHAPIRGMASSPRSRVHTSRSQQEDISPRSDAGAAAAPGQQPVDPVSSMAEPQQAQQAQRVPPSLAPAPIAPDLETVAKLLARQKVCNLTHMGLQSSKRAAAIPAQHMLASTTPAQQRDSTGSHRAACRPMPPGSDSGNAGAFSPPRHSSSNSEASGSRESGSGTADDPAPLRWTSSTASELWSPRGSGSGSTEKAAAPLLPSEMSLRAYYGSLAGQPFATPPRIRYPADRVSARRSRSLSPRASVSIPRSKVWSPVGIPSRRRQAPLFSTPPHSPSSRSTRAQAQGRLPGSRSLRKALSKEWRKPSPFARSGATLGVLDSEARALQECTFSPALCDVSRRLLEGKGDYRSPEKSQGRWRTYSISHLHIAAGPPPSLQAQEEAQLPECTFAPEVHAVPNDEVLDVFELMPSRSPVPSRPTRPQPFQSTLDAVQAKHAQHAVGLYVDVVLPTGRKGRIGVKEGSNPQQLARSFAQAFQLTPKAAIALEDHIVQQMATFGLQRGGRPGDPQAYSRGSAPASGRRRVAHGDPEDRHSQDAELAGLRIPAIARQAPGSPFVDREPLDAFDAGGQRARQQTQQQAAEGVRQCDAAGAGHGLPADAKLSLQPKGAANLHPSSMAALHDSQGSQGAAVHMPREGRLSGNASLTLQGSRAFDYAMGFESPKEEDSGIAAYELGVGEQQLEELMQGSESAADAARISEDMA